MDRSELISEEIEKISGGFYSEQLEEQEQKILRELWMEMFKLAKISKEHPEAKIEYENAKKAFRDYQSALHQKYDL